MTDALRQVLLTQTVFLGERLSSSRSAADGVPPEQVEGWLEDWAVACGGEEALARRLNWDGLTLDEVRARLRRSPGPDTLEKLEALAERARHLLSALDDADLPALPEGFTAAAANVPFMEAWIPFLRRAWQDLNLRAGENALLRLRERARADLLIGLLARCEFLGTKTLYSLFDSSRTEGQRLLLQLLGESDDTGNALYQEFVTDLTQGGWRQVFLDYPVLARLLAIALSDWTDSVAEFLERLEEDWPLLVTTFAEGRDAEGIESLDSGLSDPHCHGRSVFLLHLGGGLSVVYKPKPLGLEERFSAFLTWCNESLSMALHAPRVLLRPGYGWVEFVAHLPCRNEEEVAAYYHRSGELMALLAALSATDCHYGNIIAHGSCPVLIDGETLFHGDHPWFELPDGQMDEMATAERHRRPVLRTLMLPFWLRSDVQSTFREVGGLSLGQKPEALFARRLRNINSDAMCYAREALEEEPTKNRVILGGETRPVTEYIEPLCRGFAEGYRFVVRQRRAIFDEWLPHFAGLPVRYLFRPTVVYFWLPRDSLSPELLRCGMSFSLNLEKLSRAYLGGPAVPPAWPLLGPVGTCPCPCRSRSPQACYSQTGPPGPTARQPRTPAGARWTYPTCRVGRAIDVSGIRHA